MSAIAHGVPTSLFTATETWENLQLMGVKPAPRSQAVLLCPTSFWSAEEVRHHTTFDPELLNVTAIFDTYSKNLRPIEDFVPTFCKHKEARQAVLMQQRAIQMQETKLEVSVRILCTVPTMDTKEPMR